MKAQDSLVRLLLCVFLTLPVQACYYLQSANAPIRTIFYSAPADADREEPVTDLLLLLPGIRDYPEEFQQHDFINALHGAGSPVDVIAVNAHYRYYATRTLLMRLREDVVEPAFARGYERIHFAGVSLGGYGSLLYMREYPEDVSSIILLAPYLGQPSHYAHLLHPEAEAIPEALHDEANIWPWLISLDAKSRSKIYLGYGRGDSYAESHQLLREYLPYTHVMVVDGDHRWATWQQLWPSLLAKTQLSSKFFAVLGPDTTRTEPATDFANSNPSAASTGSR